MNQVKERTGTARALSAGLVVLMLVVVAASAWLRLMAPRSPCSDWPACRVAARGEPVAAPAAAQAPAAAAVRGAHRGAASAALLAILALLVMAGRPGTAARGARPLLVALLVLALALSALGIVTPHSRAAAVLLGNLLGGLVMLALAWAVHRRLADAPDLPPRLRRAAAGGAVLWLVQAGGGALAGAAPPAGTLLPIVHLVLAGVAVGWAFVFAGALRTLPRRPERRWLPALLALQLVLGALAASHAAAAAWVWLHNLTAAATLALWLALATARS
jgi:heme A synthase